MLYDAAQGPAIFSFADQTSVDLSDYLPDNVREPSWGPDSRSAVFASYSNLTVVSVDSGFVVSAYTIMPQGAKGFQRPAWSPEYNGGEHFIAANGWNGIYVMQPDGSRQQLVVEYGYSPTWGSNDRKLAFIRDNRIQVINLVFDIDE